MTKPLFKTYSAGIEKSASFNKRLGRESNKWPTEILKEAYAKLPYLHQYETDLSLERVDGARGYAVGKLIVYPARMKKTAAASAGQVVSFPLIIREREIAPMDVFNYEGEMHPESEESIGDIMHRAAMFERKAKIGEFEPVSLSRQVDPPTSAGRQGGFTKRSHVEKVANKKSLWDAALPTYRTEDLEDFLGQLKEDAFLRDAYLGSDVLQKFASEALNFHEKTASDIREKRHQTTPPTVVQFQKTGMDYLVKTANHRCYSPVETQMSRFQAWDMLTKEAAERLKKSDYLTIVVDPVLRETFSETVSSPIEAFGVYETHLGHEKVSGIMIPRMVTLEGNDLDRKLFVGSKNHAVQEKIAGVYKSDLTLQDAPIHGKGVFVYQVGSMAVATEPVDIRNLVEVPLGHTKEAQYHGTRYDGRPIIITIVPGLQKIASVGDYEIAIPDTFKFLPLPGKSLRVSNTTGKEDALNKRASARTLRLISDGGGSFTVLGANASAAFGKDILNEKETSFALGALGISGQQAEQLIKSASHKGSVEIPTSRMVVLEEHAKVALMVKAAEARVDVTSLRVDLVKEATVIVDKETADSVLALRFLTPENVGIYVNYLPELEKVGNKLAELLVASRLGMDHVKESAAKNAMSQVQSVITGLKKLHSAIK